MGNQQLFRDSLQLHQLEMAHGIEKCVAKTGDWPTPIQDVLFFRRDAVSQPDFCLIEPSLVMVVQGEKEILVGDHAYPYNPTNFLITSLDLPASSQVVSASKAIPCLGLVVKIDVQTLTELVPMIPREHLNRQKTPNSIGLGEMTEPLLDALRRLVQLVETPNAIDVMAPLIKREIHYRLLLSEQTELLRQIASIDSHSHRIAKAIDWLKQNYATALRVEELSDMVQMSPPSFHKHFRQLTSMSPIKYQKWLRLNEAKRLMLNEHLDASSAAYKVGYESPSQFSREYNRLFGAPPKRDILRTKEIG